MIGTRIQQRIDDLGVSQSELARQTGLNQSTINGLVRGHQRSSVHLHRIARALQTTPAFLEGDIDDPDLGAPPPLAAPTIQYVTLPVALPSEGALTGMFEGLLAASPRLHGVELARELAKLLPTALGALRGPLIEPAMAPPDAEREPAASAASAHRAPRQASRT